MPGHRLQLNKLNTVAFTIGKKSIISTAVILALLIGHTWTPKIAPIGKNSIHNLFSSLAFVIESHNDIARYEQMIDRINITRVPDLDQTPAIVLIVGESFNRHHSNLYGYRLNTQPRLKAEADSGNLLVFTNCTTPSLSTNKCIKFLFTHRRCTSTDADNDDDANYVVMPAV
ncbi:MAG: sulfatase-like hydrolase/transferase, partial [Candidatus Limisoma sp.]